MVMFQFAKTVSSFVYQRVFHGIGKRAGYGFDWGMVMNPLEFVASGYDCYIAMEAMAPIEIDGLPGFIYQTWWFSMANC